jgi:hypothetical protein
MRIRRSLQATEPIGPAGAVARELVRAIVEDDDACYLAWVDGHQHGFVVNTYRKPDPRYLILHQASCGTIHGKPACGERWTTGYFIKACAENRAALDQWARQNVGGELHPCALCRPD